MPEDRKQSATAVKLSSQCLKASPISSGPERKRDKKKNYIYIYKYRYSNFRLIAHLLTTEENKITGYQTLELSGANDVYYKQVAGRQHAV